MVTNRTGSTVLLRATSIAIAAVTLIALGQLSSAAEDELEENTSSTAHPDATGESSQRPDGSGPHTTSSMGRLSTGPTVLSVRAYGKSVNGHVLRAYETGDRQADTTVVVMAAMHGNEPAGITVVNALRDGDPIQGIHLWLIPRMNPDGVLRDDRHNAHGVDLNRNFPVSWIKQTGYYDSGPRASSERETRALQRFLDNVNPDYVVSFHQPLHGVDIDSAKDVKLSRALHRNLDLPKKSFTCNNGCHGTMTQWFNKTHAGAAVTVEFGADPSQRYLTRRAPRGILKTFGATR